MTYKEALKYIHSVNWVGSKLGLERTQELLEKLGNPQKELKFIHIAGTNGKGSTAAMLSSILERAGYRTGLYTSPFINRFNERMQVNGEQIPDGTLAELTDHIRPYADAMEDAPTEFELITALPWSTSAGRGAISSCWRWAWAGSWTPPMSSTPPRRRLSPPWAWTM